MVIIKWAGAVLAVGLLAVGLLLCVAEIQAIPHATPVTTPIPPGR